MSNEKKDTGSQSGFKVTDKRHFTSQGDVVEGAGEEAAPPPEEPSASPAPEPTTPPPPAEPAREEPSAKGPDEENAPPGEGGKVDFAHLVMSLAGTAYHSLGMPDPVTRQQGKVDLTAASQMIDLLAVLDEKTRGNLSPQEEQILKGVLTELRALFVQASGFGG